MRIRESASNHRSDGRATDSGTLCLLLTCRSPMPPFSVAWHRYTPAGIAKFPAGPGASPFRVGGAPPPPRSQARRRIVLSGSGGSPLRLSVSWAPAGDRQTVRAAETLGPHEPAKRTCSGHAPRSERRTRPWPWRSSQSSAARSSCSATSRNQYVLRAVQDYECSLKLAPQSAFTCPVVPRSQARYAGA
jgi:hypothetical protein